MDAQVNRARHAAKLAEQVGGKPVVRIQVEPGYLDIDGCGQAEIKRLANDVSRQEIERNAGELSGQFAAELANVEIGRPVIGVESNQNIGVHGAHRRRIAVGHVDGTVRKPNVVDNAG